MRQHLLGLQHFPDPSTAIPPTWSCFWRLSAFYLTNSHSQIHAWSWSLSLPTCLLLKDSVLIFTILTSWTPFFRIVIDNSNGRVSISLMCFSPLYYYYIPCKFSAKSTHVYERENSLMKVRGLCPVASVSPWAATVCLPQVTAAKPDHDSRVNGPVFTGLLVTAS